MNKEISNWIDNALSTNISEQVIAFCFNLYEDTNNNWVMELVGSDWFDLENEDWPSNELTEFDTRENPYRWKIDCEWDEALAYMVNQLKEYLEVGKYAELLKSSTGVGVGFVDGNIEILHCKIN